MIFDHVLIEKNTSKSIEVLEASRRVKEILPAKSELHNLWYTYLGASYFKYASTNISLLHHIM